jgi:hypothetical protein
VRQCGQERPVSWSEPHSRCAELSLQHSDLVSQGEDLKVFVAIAHG